MRPLMFPVAGSVTTIINCQGPLDAPIFVGSGIMSTKSLVPLLHLITSLSLMFRPISLTILTIAYLFLLLYTKAKPKAVIRKQEIRQQAKEIFRREISESEYAQVVDDICITTEDGVLILKSGD